MIALKKSYYLFSVLRKRQQTPLSVQSPAYELEIMHLYCIEGKPTEAQDRREIPARRPTQLNEGVERGGRASYCERSWERLFPPGNSRETLAANRCQFQLLICTVLNRPLSLESSTACRVISLGCQCRLSGYICLQ